MIQRSISSSDIDVGEDDVTSLSTAGVGLISTTLSVDEVEYLSQVSYSTWMLYSIY
jgi:hypothetical protein